MVNESRDTALCPLAPGELIRLGQGSLAVDIAPNAGGRIAQIHQDGVEWLVGYGGANTAMIAWGSYPMLPWAGRIRRGRFDFGGRGYALSPNLGDHAIHGIGFAMPWHVDAHSSVHVDLSLQLPEDQHWPFGGHARQRFDIGENRLRMELSLTAGAHAMPAAIGWHPWWRKPDGIEFSPNSMYARDANGIAVHPRVTPKPGPWDDCFVNDKPVLIHRGQRSMRLTSNCGHWVVFDETAHATCIEPQSGPPDAFNIEPMQLTPNSSLAAWFLLEWL